MNKIVVKVLSDGTLNVQSPGGFSPELHMAADEFVKWLESQVGSVTIVKKIEGQHQHGHAHQHHTHKH